MIKKIISGGQPGVEIAALDAAIKLNIPHEGWCYKSRKSEEGVLEEKYNVKEIDTPSYFERLEKNIMHSDGTVVLSYGQFVMGYKAVKDITDKYNKPHLYVNLSTHPLNQVIFSIRKWITNHAIGAVYFTGSKSGGTPNTKIYEEVLIIIEGICGVEREPEKFLGFKEADDSENF